MATSQIAHCSTDAFRCAVHPCCQFDRLIMFSFNSYVNSLANISQPADFRLSFISCRPVNCCHRRINFDILVVEHAKACNCVLLVSLAQISPPSVSVRTCHCGSHLSTRWCSFPRHSFRSFPSARRTCTFLQTNIGYVMLLPLMVVQRHVSVFCSFLADVRQAGPKSSLRPQVSGETFHPLIYASSHIITGTLRTRDDLGPARLISGLIKFALCLFCLH